MDRVTNRTNISLSVAAALATDEYDYNPEAKTISTTTLIQPLRPLILSQRVTPDMIVPPDVLDYAATFTGTAIHNAIEHTWKNPKLFKQALRRLGLPSKVIDRVVVNPSQEYLDAGCIPVYMEQRISKEIDGWTVTGKYDFIYKGTLEDHKTTKAYAVQKGDIFDKYAQQGSIYKWINPEIITDDRMNVNLFIKDWNQGSTYDKTYPPAPIMTVSLPLASVGETERFIRKRIADLQKYMDADQSEIPYCSDKELWRKDTVYKYYKNPAKKSRSTANFPTLQEANTRLASDGFVGEVVTVPGEVSACKYCAALPICSQAKQLQANGDLKL